LLVEDERKKVYYNKQFVENVTDQNLPHLANIKMISMSPTYKFISYLAFVANQWVLSVLSDDYEASTFF